MRRPTMDGYKELMARAAELSRQGRALARSRIRETDSTVRAILRKEAAQADAEAMRLIERADGL